MQESSATNGATPQLPPEPKEAGAVPAELTQPELLALAEKVMTLLKRELRLERERLHGR